MPYGSICLHKCRQRPGRRLSRREFQVSPLEVKKLCLKSSAPPTPANPTHSRPRGGRLRSRSPMNSSDMRKQGYLENTRAQAVLSPYRPLFGYLTTPLLPGDWRSSPSVRGRLKRPALHHRSERGLRWEDKPPCVAHQASPKTARASAASNRCRQQLRSSGCARNPIPKQEVHATPLLDFAYAMP